MQLKIKYVTLDESFARTEHFKYLNWNLTTGFDIIKDHSCFIEVYLQNDTDDSQTLINANDDNLNIVIFDKNISLLNDKTTLLFNEPGTCQIGVYYNELYLKEEILIYKTFYKDIYKKHLLPQFEATNLEANYKLKIILDTLIEMIDILFAYTMDVQDINSPLFVKKKFLDLLGYSKNMLKMDKTKDNTINEKMIDNLYRELLLSLLDLIKLRGTKLSYELFFNALGYDIELLEYWFDNEGRLIEIDPSEDTALDPYSSNFYAYTDFGNVVDYSKITDPRKDVDANGIYNKNQKSKYVKVKYQAQDITRDLYGQNNLEQILLIKQYLQLLKPMHIEYLQDILSINILNGSGNVEDILCSFEDAYDHLKDKDLFTFIQLKYPKYGYYFSSNTLLNINNENKILIDNENVNKWFSQSHQSVAFNLGVTLATVAGLTQGTEYNATIMIDENEINISFVATLNMTIEAVIAQITLAVGATASVSFSIPDTFYILTITSKLIGSNSLISIIDGDNEPLFASLPITSINATTNSIYLNRWPYYNAINWKYWLENSGNFDKDILFKDTTGFEALAVYNPPGRTDSEFFTSIKNINGTGYSAFDWNIGGLCIEHLKAQTEKFMTSSPKYLQDTLSYFLKYDSNLFYDGESIIKYDAGIIFLENSDTAGAPNVLDIQAFLSRAKALVTAAGIVISMQTTILDTAIYNIYLTLSEEFKLKFSEIRNIIKNEEYGLTILDRTLLRRFVPWYSPVKTGKGVLFDDKLFNDSIFSTTT